MITTIDAEILLFIQEHLRNTVCDIFFKGITHLGDAGIFWILLTVVLLCFRRTRKAGIFSACALIGSLAVNNMLLKNLIGRVRPYEVVDGLRCIVSLPHDSSFPSGHTGASFSSAVALFPHLPRRYGVLCLVLASLIAFSRLYVGVHYPTDVLAGLITGITIGLCVNIIGNRIVAQKRKG